MIQKFVIADRLERIEQQFQARFKYDYRPLLCVDGLDNSPVILQGKSDQIIEMNYGMPIKALRGRILFNSPVEGTEQDEYMSRNGEPKAMIDNVIFMLLLKQKRCVIPASALLYFVEQDDTKDLFLTHYMSKQIRPFGLAGIWDEYEHPETKEKRIGYCLLTASISSLAARFDQPKSPILLVGDEVKKWLSPHTRTHELESMMICGKQHEQNMNAFPVSKSLVQYQNPEPRWLQPIGNSIIGSTQYVTRKPLNKRSKRR